MCTDQTRFEPYGSVFLTIHKLYILMMKLSILFIIYLIAGSIHKNVITNLEEIERNQRYLAFHSSCVSFIGTFVRKPDQFALQAARETLGEMQDIYHNVVEQLAKPVSPSQRLDMNKKEMWQTFYKARKKMNKIRPVLWEVEAREEKVAELDDWRQEPGHFTCPSLDTICRKIDKQNKKIFQYDKEDVQKRWKTVENDLKKLQLLRVQV